MPQETQIVPKYLHSHVETYVNDNTQFEDTVSTPVDTNSKFFAVFRSGSGPDNVLIKKDDLSDFYKTYGRSNYAKYGQPLMMPINMLSTGAATVYCMRVMPDDAYAANCVLCAQYKFDDSTGKMVIRFKASYIDQSVFDNTSAYKTAKTFKKQLRAYAAALKTTDPDADGYLTLPIATFRMSGRGVYGNNYRWRIARNMDYENDYGIKMYSFEALNTDNGLQKVQTYVGSIVTSPKYKATTLINDVLDDQETGAAVMDVQVFDENVEDLYAQFVEFVQGLDAEIQDVIPDVDEFDPLFGRIVGSDLYHKNIEIVAESIGSDFISVDRPQGMSLLGGSDGAFASPNETTVYNAENECYINAFNGMYDKAILSTRMTPVNAIFDANYAFEVKEALADLANARDSALLYLDCGTETTFAEIENIIEDYAIFNTRNISKNFQHYTVKDFETKKKCEVTVTYFFAQELPRHFKAAGSHIPFAKSYAQLSGHIRNSLEPCISDVDAETKELLYNARINYFELIEENVYQRSSQNTAQNVTSDLMEENNAHTLFEIKSIVEKDCWEALYTFTSAEDRARFTEVENAKFADWSNRKVQTITINFDVNEWEAERSIVHCYVAVQFRNLMKRVIIEIDVNKRDFTA